jgi:hypothetical protein
VQSSDPVTGKTVVRAVTALHRNLDDDLVDLTVRDADGNVTVVHTTARHRFWDDTTRQWTETVDLKPGERLHTTSAATVTVASVAALDGEAWMNDLTIHDTHNYYIVSGDNPILAHNCGEVAEVPTSPKIDPGDIAGRTPAEIDAFAQEHGLIPKGPDPMAGKGSYTDPITGQQRVLCHPAACPPHAHVNNPAGQRLDINGNVVPAESPAAHLPLGAPL